MVVLEASGKFWKAPSKTHLEGGGLQPLADVVLLLLQRAADQSCSFGHVWMVVLLQRLET